MSLSVAINMLEKCHTWPTSKINVSASGKKINYFSAPSEKVWTWTKLSVEVNMSKLKSCSSLMCNLCICRNNQVQFITALCINLDHKIKNCTSFTQQFCNLVEIGLKGWVIERKSLQFFMLLAQTKTHFPDWHKKCPVKELFDPSCMQLLMKMLMLEYNDVTDEPVL